MGFDFTDWNPEAAPERRATPTALTPEGVAVNANAADAILAATAITAGALYVRLQQLEASRRHAVAALRENPKNDATIAAAGRQLSIDLQNVRVALEVLKATAVVAIDEN